MDSLAFKLALGYAGAVLGAPAMPLSEKVSASCLEEKRVSAYAGHGACRDLLPLARL